MESILENYSTEEPHPSFEQPASQEASLCCQFDALDADLDDPIYNWTSNDWSEFNKPVNWDYKQEEALSDDQEEPLYYTEENKPSDTKPAPMMNKSELDQLVDELKNKSICQCVVRRSVNGFHETFYGFGPTMPQAIMDAHNHFHNYHKLHGKRLIRTCHNCFICQIEETGMINLETGDTDSEYRTFNFADAVK